MGGMSAADRTNRARPRNPETGVYVTKLTDDVVEKICLALKGGNTIETAAAWGGVSRSTLHDWMRAGRNGGTPRERRFVASVELAMAEWEVATVAGVSRAAQDDWRAAMELLARRFPERWGQTSRVNVGGPDGEALQVEHHHRHTLNIGALSDDDIATMEAIMERAQAAKEPNGEVLQLPRGSS